MKKALPLILVLFALLLTVPGSAFSAGKSVESLFKGKADASYRVPSDAGASVLLEKDQVLPRNATAQQRQETVDKYLSEFVKWNQDTPNPAKYRKLLEAEQNGTTLKAADRSLKSLVVLAEFNPTPETWTAAVDDAGNCTPTEVTFAGPLHNQIPPPGPRDNNTIWYKDASPSLYEEIYFGEGPTAGVVVDHPNLGKVDLRGKTMVNYYLELSNGKFAPSGEVYPMWFQALHSEAWYGEDSCSGGHNVRAQDLVLEMLDNVNATDPNFNWQEYDGDGDGVVDNFTVIHAGMGQEAGGGSQGNWAIWSHASLVGWPSGVKVCTAGATGCPDRDIVVFNYSMDPENIDLGVIAEEFGHAAFGLPDIYTTDAQLSVSNWAIMEAGSWNGILGGAEPAPFPLWFKFQLGWANMKTINYDDPALTTEVAQLEKPAPGKYDGLRINLPPKQVAFPNPLNTGKAWWSSQANVVNYTLTRDLNLTGTATPVLSFLSNWSIEEGWDYGYVQVSTDGGATWTFLDDIGSYFTADDPNGTSQGVGLTGEGQDTLSFNLTPYANQNIKLRLLYSTDSAVQWNGWFADNFSVVDGSTSVWSDDTEGDLSSWTATGWTLVPNSKSFNRYYLVEWRNNQGFDHGLQYPYATVYSDEDEWQVDRAPYTVPGMLVYFRDTSYSTDYTLYDSIYDGPSWGTKHALILVDSHYWPLTWNDWKYGSGAFLRVNSRVQPGNSSFTLQPTKAFTLHLGFDPSTGQYLQKPIQTKTFRPQPGVSAFHDSLGYYPGLQLGVDNGLWWVDKAASAVIPAAGDYSTRITDIKHKPLTDLYGLDMGGTLLGSGNPGDEGKQFGLHIAVVSKSADGTSAQIATWNSPQVVVGTIVANKSEVARGETIVYTVKLQNTTPITQKFTATSKLPAGTAFVRGANYNPLAKTFRWTGTLGSNQTKTFTFTVRVGAKVSSGGTITANVNVTDDALGSKDQDQVLVK